MADNVRATVYFNPKVYRALRIKAAESGETISGLIGQAVLESFREDQIDRQAFKKRETRAVASAARCASRFEARWTHIAY